MQREPLAQNERTIKVMFETREASSMINVEEAFKFSRLKARSLARES